MSIRQGIQQGLGVGIGIAIVVAIGGGGYALVHTLGSKSPEATQVAATNPAPPTTQPATTQPTQQAAQTEAAKQLQDEARTQKRKELIEIMADLAIYMADGHDQWPDRLDVAHLGLYMKTTGGPVVQTMSEIQYQKPSTSYSKTPKSQILGRLPLDDGSYYTFDADDNLILHKKD